MRYKVTGLILPCTCLDGKKRSWIIFGTYRILVGLVQGVLIRWINPKIGNERSIYYGLGLYAIGMLLFAFATESWMMFAFWCLIV